MNREKRTTKLLEFKQKSNRFKSKASEKKLKLSEESYNIIGLPPKYASAHDIYLLPGNIPCSQREDSFVMDFSWLNEFHVFREVEVQEKALVIHCERRTDSRFPRLKNFINKLMKMRNRDLRLWGRAIKGFSESCKKITKQLIDQQPIPQFNINFQNLEGEGKTAGALQVQENSQDYFLQLKSYFRGSESRLFQIIVNENFVKILGYSNQAFCSQILQEGLPEIFASHDEKNSQFLFGILEEFGELSIEMPYRKTSFFETSIKAKSGYVKNVRVQVNFQINYQNNRFESDLQFHIQNSEGLYYFPDDVDEQKINKHFVEIMKEKEEQLNEFLRNYYNLPRQSWYSNLDKICRFQEF